jgi:hypothetical protein
MDTDVDSTDVTNTVKNFNRNHEANIIFGELMLMQHVEAQPSEGDGPHLKARRIRIICPCCLKTGSITVDEELTKNEITRHDDKLTYMRVFSGEICEHEFTIHIDGQFKMR